MKRKNGGGKLRLYHFCTDSMLKGILRDGLTLGRTPIQEPDPIDPDFFYLKGFINETQWMTTDPDWERQSWCTSHSISYRRDDWRLTIDLGPVYRARLLTASQFCKRKNLHPMLYEKFKWSENWRVYIGKIPPSKIVKCDPRPSRAEPVKQSEFPEVRA